MDSFIEWFEGLGCLGWIKQHLYISVFISVLLFGVCLIFGTVMGEFNDDFGVKELAIFTVVFFIDMIIVYPIFSLIITILTLALCLVINANGLYDFFDVPQDLRRR